ncbi:MAG: type I restriction endonuclease, partial [Chloroflexota bacterium]
MIRTSEQAFEDAIEATLLTGGPDALRPPEIRTKETDASYQTRVHLYPVGGYHKRSCKGAEYVASLALIPRDLFDFIQASQPKMWAKYLKIHKGNVAEAKQQFQQKLAKDLNRRGTLALLRGKGFRLEGCTFKLIYFKPASRLNPETQTLYQANRFSVLRQLYYKPRSANKPQSGPSIDLGLFINGLPIFTVELKNQLTLQTVEDSKRQYRKDRDPKEPLLAYGRCLAHFAVDTNDVYVTSHLRGEETTFLPLNQGYGGGAGNEPSALGFATSYLWEQLWAKNSVLNLIEHFIHEIELEDDKGNKTGEKRLIFP